MAKAPKLPISKIKLIENEYHDQHGNIYSALKLIEKSKEYESFDLPLAGVPVNMMNYGIDSAYDFVYHMQRTLDVDPKYPIILDDQGVICDGWHRVAKAMLEGKEFIKAIRLLEMPEKDRRDPE
jgi:hypothetical protein